MSLAVAAVSSLLGWATLAATTVWYWRVIVPTMYEDQSVLPFVAAVSLSALAYLGVLAGAWRRRQSLRDGLPMMVVGACILAAVIISTLTTTGVLLLPSFLIATLAAALPAHGLPAAE
jgi:hypothetical protein